MIGLFDPCVGVFCSAILMAVLVTLFNISLLHSSLTNVLPVRLFARLSFSIQISFLPITPCDDSCSSIVLLFSSSVASRILNVFAAGGVNTEVGRGGAQRAGQHQSQLLGIHLFILLSFPFIFSSFSDCVCFFFDRPISTRVFVRTSVGWTLFRASA